MQNIGPVVGVQRCDIAQRPKGYITFKDTHYTIHILFLSDRSSVLYMIIPHTRFIYSIYTQPHQRDDVIIILLLCNYTET